MLASASSPALELYRLSSFEKSETELFGGANKRLFGCFPRQTARERVRDHNEIFIFASDFDWRSLTGQELWPREVYTYIFLYISFPTGIFLLRSFFESLEIKMWVCWLLCPLPTVLYLTICGWRESMFYGVFVKLQRCVLIVFDFLKEERSTVLGNVPLSTPAILFCLCYLH